MMTPDDMIAVIRAHQDGKDIEYTYANCMHNPCWLSMQSPQFFNFSECIYRIKPEPRKPREWWITFKDKGKPGLSVDAWPFELPGGISIHVREVID